jgi:uncharacterized membrane protein YqjE
MAWIGSRIRRALAAGSSLLLLRAEFAVAELSEAGTTAMRWVVTALIAFALLIVAVGAVSATIVLALWDRWGWYPMGVLAALYAGAALFLVSRLLREIRTRPPMLAQTFAELAKDREALFGGDPGAAPDAGP